MEYYLGVDIGSTKTQVLIADGSGRIVGQAISGPGNYQTVGYEGMHRALQVGFEEALDQAGISREQIYGSGFGISGYDWPSDKPKMLATISRMGLKGPLEIQNDAILGLVAGADEGWGISVVSGTGCNCWGWDRDRTKIGRVTGFGEMAGEAAGSTELVFRAMQLVAQAWTKRGGETGLSQAFIDYVGAGGIEDLLEGYTTGRYQVDGGASRLVFQVAAGGDQVAQELVHWAGSELGELVKAVIHQLDFHDLEFDVVMVGSMFEAGPMLIDPLRESIISLAPGARLVRLDIPPVVGAVLLGMEAAGIGVSAQVLNSLKGAAH